MPPREKKARVAPVLTYWPIQGRAEVIRIALALAGQPWEETSVSDEEYASKPLAGTDKQPYGQWPLLLCEDGVICQSDAILRYVMRKFLKASSLPFDEQTVVDQILPGVEPIRQKYGALIWGDKLADPARDAFIATHVDPASAKGKCDGGHVAYLEGFLQRKKGETPWIAGSKAPTAADIEVYNIVNYVKRLVPKEKFEGWYPRLTAHQSAFEAIPQIKEYIATKQHKNVNDESGIGN